MLAYLVRFFFRRFFDAGSSAADIRLTPKGAFALLVIPGCVMSILLMQKYSSVGRFTRKQWVWDLYAQSVPDKYLFIVYCMVVSALVALLRWDSLFPDRRDFANLAPLPLEMRTIFTAKVLALCQFVLAFVLVVNAGSTLLFPPVALEGSGTLAELVGFMAAHAGTMVLAGIWSFSVVLAVTGLLVALLPFSLLRQARRATQFAGVTALILLVLSTPETLKQVSSSDAPAWLPPVWFLGFYEMLAGRATPELTVLGERALLSTLAALLLAIVAYALTYRMFFLRSAEAVAGAGSILRIPEFAFRPLDATVMRNSYHGGCFRFIVKTLARSDRHSAALAAMLGLGCTVAALNVLASNPHARSIPAGVLVANFVALYTLTTALRVAFGVPSEPEANWIFRATAGPNIDPRDIVKRAMACFALPLAVLPSIAFAALYDPVLALVHLVYASLATAMLIEILAFDFRAIPFTCSWMPGRKYPAVAAMGWFAGLITAGQMLGGIEFFYLGKPAGMTVVLLLMGAAILLLRRAQDSGDAVAWADTRGELELLRITTD
jgi:hypothetical protein